MSLPPILEPDANTSIPLDPLHPQHNRTQHRPTGSLSGRANDSAGERSISRHSKSLPRPYTYPPPDADWNTPRPSFDEQFLHPARAGDSQDGSSTVSPCSTVTNTPAPSRPPSPPPLYSSGTSSYDSDSDGDPDGEEPQSPLLGSARLIAAREALWQETQRPRWWPFGVPQSTQNGWGTGRRRRSPLTTAFRSCKRFMRRLVRHPYFPKTPVTILLTLLCFIIFGVSLTFLLIYILNPDKEPLPWRGYCTIPPHDGRPPSLKIPTTVSFPPPQPGEFALPTFPPDNLDSLAPAGVYIGVFSIDAAVERRMLVRSTWASHVRSREGAGKGDGGAGTSRTVVRFILGQPRKDWERRVQLEAETYNDMVVLPMSENMNNGKTHMFFSWAANHSWVPPIYSNISGKAPEGFSYTNTTHPAPLALALHDPIQARQDQLSDSGPQHWVRPDFVVKSDDDSFVMLAELEARLRVELHKELIPPLPPSERKLALSARDDGDAEEVEVKESVSATARDDASSPLSTNPSVRLATSPLLDTHPADPLVFWGYLVKNRFMAGELYAMSWSLVDWVAHEPLIKTMVRGAEDKQTSKWIQAHPRAQQVRWSSERCWIYDHPRAGTVYSHGFLFPSHAKRVQKEVQHDLALMKRHLEKQDPLYNGTLSPLSLGVPFPQSWTQSSVSKFGVRYNPPLPEMSLNHSIEAFVEGSEMSSINEDAHGSPDMAWWYREGRQRRYQGKRVGGTIIVHFLKKNMWFLETAAALLHGEDITEYERSRQGKEAGMRTPVVTVPEEREVSIPSTSASSTESSSAGDETALAEATSVFTENAGGTEAYEGHRLPRTLASRADREKH